MSAERHPTERGHDGEKHSLQVSIVIGITMYT